jgi:hypothetical protein
MATKFASIYKQELKSKGVLSSMGSAVLKGIRERMDVRNMLFGGKGMLSATGQKVFGTGYSALSSGGMATTSNSQMAAQSAATGELISSNERQEALLRVVAKNTFNMNMMARDMNITRQNIATMTRVMAGQAAQSQDAMWYDVKTRNQAIDSLGKKETGPTKKEETKSSGGGIFSNITGAIGSVIGTLGGIGGGILSALSIVARLSPILAIIGVMASAYVISDARMTGDQNAGAMGRYGFMPFTIRGALKTAGLSEADIFSPENQEKLYEAVLKNMVSGLRAQGFTNITDDLINLAWHVGPKGAKDLVEALKTNPNAIPADILKLSPGGRKTNPMLQKQTVEEFLRGRQLSQGSLDLNDNTRLAMLPDVGGGTTVVAPQNTTVVAGGKSQAFAGAIDAEALYLFT